jgi:SAM-dependent methyltransferase
LRNVDETVRHPIFARVCAFMARWDEREMGAYRDELLDGLTGDVVEIGAGTGLNFPHFPAGVESVVAVEPEPYLRRRAEAMASEAPVPVRVRAGIAERLPLDDHSCDAAVSCLVLCSVSSQAKALDELKRVLRPGGELRFAEHVLGDGGAKARAQRLLDRSKVWPGLVGGCHCGRETMAAIETAGFELQRERRLTIGPTWFPANPIVLGAGRLPSSSASHTDPGRSAERT